MAYLWIVLSSYFVEALELPESQLAVAAVPCDSTQRAPSSCQSSHSHSVHRHNWAGQVLADDVFGSERGDSGRRAAEEGSEAARSAPGHDARRLVRAATPPPPSRRPCIRSAQLIRACVCVRLCASVRVCVRLCASVCVSVRVCAQRAQRHHAHPLRHGAVQFGPCSGY